MASSSTTSSDSDVERSRHVSSKHKRKEKSHKKTKKRYKHRSDDDEKGYKKFKRKKEKKEKREKQNSSDEDNTPKPQAAGPSVERPSEIPENRNPAPNPEVDNSYGPALPPHLMKTQNPSPSEPKVIGPVIPSHLLTAVQASHDETPALESDPEPKNDESHDDDDILDTVGPLPGVINPELEQRALEIKLGHVSSSGTNDANKEKSRDEWMLELPEVRGVTDLGLTARQFRTKERPDFSDRSQWTDTPADKERKKHGQPTEKEIAKDEERQMERQAIMSRDAEQERIAKEHKKKHKRDKSLMDLHEKKLKKAKKEKEKEPEVRRPFDRNIDLAANHFDEAQKKSIIKKAQLLDTRFSSGASKFL